jgi:hypothetical protein
MGTRRISYQELREKREEHEKKQSEIEYICLHFGAILFGRGAPKNNT